MTRYNLTDLVKQLPINVRGLVQESEGKRDKKSESQKCRPAFMQWFFFLSL